MILKTFLLSDGRVVAVKKTETAFMLIYEEDTCKLFKNMKELRKWVKLHFNEELT